MFKDLFSGRSETGSKSGRSTSVRSSSDQKKSQSNQTDSAMSSSTRKSDEDRERKRSRKTNPYDDDASSTSKYVTAPSSRIGESQSRRPTESVLGTLPSEDDDWEDEDGDARNEKKSRRSADGERHKRRKHRSEREKSRSHSRDRRDKDKRSGGAAPADSKPDRLKDDRDRKHAGRRDAANGRSESSRAIPEMGSFEQFPGQYDGGVVGPPSQQNSLMSGALPGPAPVQQFPNQLPSEYDRPAAPIEPRRGESYGEAAEYYMDQGQSVEHQPGKRAHTPNMLVNADPHLMTASAEAHPAQDTGHGSAADFYGGRVSPVVSGPQQSSTKPVKSGKSSASGAAMAAGALAAGAALGFAAHQASSSSSQQQGSQRPGKQGSKPSRHSSDGNVYYSASSSSYAQGTSGKVSNGTNIPPYAAGAAAADFAAGQSHQHKYSNVYDTQNMSRSPELGQPSGAPRAPYGSAGQHHTHEHKGPMTRFKDGFFDLLSSREDTAKMELYTEYIGVCRYCFDPRTSAWDAPRIHHHGRRRESYEELRRRKSLERMQRQGSSESLRRAGGTRVDKDYRYYASESSRQRRQGSKADLVGAGLAAAGVAAGANAIFGNKKDFDDTYSVKSGHRESSAVRRRSRSSSHERRRRATHGVVHPGGEEEYVTVRTKDGRMERRKSTRRSRSRSRDKRTSAGLGLGTAAGIALGSAAVAGKSRHRSRSHGRRSPGRNSYYNISRHDRPEESDGLFGGFFSPPSKKNRRDSRREHQKKQRGFFTFSNGSSSSSNSDLAFGEGFASKTSLPLHRKSSTKVSRKRSDEHIAATVAGIGATAAALAAAQQGHRISKRTSRPELGARKDVSQHHSGPDHRHGSPGTSDDDWEDELPSDVDDASSVDGGLAFGDHHRVNLAGRQSRESLSSQSSEAEPSGWGWGWGGHDKKGRKTAEHPPPKQSDAPGTFGPGMNDVNRPLRPGETLYRDDSGRPLPSANPSWTSLQQHPMQNVDPRPISDAGSLSGSRHPSMPGSYEYDDQAIPVSRPGPGPIQQPQPIAPKQAAFTQSPPPMDEGRPYKPRRANSSPVRGTFAQDAALIGGAALATTGIIAGVAGRKGKEPSNVRFGFTEEQKRKAERQRRDDDREAAEERRRADRTRAVKEEAERTARESRQEEIRRAREEENRKAAEARLRQDGAARAAAAENRDRRDQEDAYHREQARFAEDSKRKQEYAAAKDPRDAGHREPYSTNDDRYISSQRDRRQRQRDDDNRERERSEQGSHSSSSKRGTFAGAAAGATVGAVLAGRAHQKHHERDSADDAEDDRRTRKVRPDEDPSRYAREQQALEREEVDTERRRKQEYDERDTVEITPPVESAGRHVPDDALDDPDFFKKPRAKSRSTSRDRYEDLARKATDKVMDKYSAEDWIADRDSAYKDKTTQAAFFTPDDISSKDKDEKLEKEVQGPPPEHADNEIQVYQARDPLIKSHFHPSKFDAVQTKSRHAPYGVPGLFVSCPTPPPPSGMSRSARETDKQGSSPLSRVQTLDDDEPEDTTGPEKTERSQSISWGEDQTHVYEQQTPDYRELDSYITNPEAHSSGRSRDEADADEVVVEDAAGNQTKYDAKHFGQDDRRTRDDTADDDVEDAFSDPDTPRASFRRAFFEPDVGFGGFQVDSPGTEGAPPVRGFVEGETDEPTPAEEKTPHIPGGFDDESDQVTRGKDDSSRPTSDREVIDVTKEGLSTKKPDDPEDVAWEPPLSKKEKKKRGKAAKRASTAEELPSWNDSEPDTPQEGSVPPLEPEDEPADYFMSKKDKKKRDKASKRAGAASTDSKEQTTNGSRDAQIEADEPNSEGMAPFEQPRLSKKEQRKLEKESKKSGFADIAAAMLTTAGVASVAAAVDSNEDSGSGSSTSKKKGKKNNAKLGEPVERDIRDLEPQREPLSGAEESPAAEHSAIPGSWDDDSEEQSSHRPSRRGLDSADRENSKALSAGEDEDDLGNGSMESNPKREAAVNRNSGAWNAPATSSPLRSEVARDSKNDLLDEDSLSSDGRQRMSRRKGQPTEYRNGSSHEGEGNDDQSNEALYKYEADSAASSRAQHDTEDSSASKKGKKGSIFGMFGRKPPENGALEDELDSNKDQSFLGMRVEDLPPLPASPPGSPSLVANKQKQGVGAPVSTERGTGAVSEQLSWEDEAKDLPPLPISRPDSPTATLETPARPGASVRPASSTAVPLRFPFIHGPITPGSLPKDRAANLSSPISGSMPVSPVSGPRTRQGGRPGSMEIREFRPLYLVERNRKTPEVEDSLPSLPSSKPSSRASSVHGSDEYESAAEDLESPKRHRGLSINTSTLNAGSQREYEFLDSQQNTPKASDFSQVPFERHTRQEPQYYTWEDLAREQQMHDAAVQDAALEESHQRSPSLDLGRAKEAPANLQPSISPGYSARHELRNVSRSRSESPAKLSGGQLKGIAAAAMLGTAAVYAGHELRSPEHNKRAFDSNARDQDEPLASPLEAVGPLPAPVDDLESNAGVLSALDNAKTSEPESPPPTQEKYWPSHESSVVSTSDSRRTEALEAPVADAAVADSQADAPIESGEQSTEVESESKPSTVRAASSKKKGKKDKKGKKKQSQQRQEEFEDVPPAGASDMPRAPPSFHRGDTDAFIETEARAEEGFIDNDPQAPSRVLEKEAIGSTGEVPANHRSTEIAVSSPVESRDGVDQFFDAEQRMEDGSVPPPAAEHTVTPHADHGSQSDDAVDPSSSAEHAPSEIPLTSSTSPEPLTRLDTDKFLRTEQQMEQGGVDFSDERETSTRPEQEPSDGSVCRIQEQPGYERSLELERKVSPVSMGGSRSVSFLNEEAEMEEGHAGQRQEQDRRSPSPSGNIPKLADTQEEVIKDTSSDPMIEADEDVMLPPKPTWKPSKKAKRQQKLASRQAAEEERLGDERTDEEPAARSKTRTAPTVPVGVEDLPRTSDPASPVGSRYEQFYEAGESVSQQTDLPRDDHAKGSAHASSYPTFGMVDYHNVAYPSASAWHDHQSQSFENAMSQSRDAPSDPTARESRGRQEFDSEDLEDLQSTRKPQRDLSADSEAPAATAEPEDEWETTPVSRKKNKKDKKEKKRKTSLWTDPDSSSLPRSRYEELPLEDSQTSTAPNDTELGSGAGAAAAVLTLAGSAALIGKALEQEQPVEEQSAEAVTTISKKQSKKEKKKQKKQGLIWSGLDEDSSSIQATADRPTPQTPDDGSESTAIIEAAKDARLQLETESSPREGSSEADAIAMGESAVDRSSEGVQLDAREREAVQPAIEANITNEVQPMEDDGISTIAQQDTSIGERTMASEHAPADEQPPSPAEESAEPFTWTPKKKEKKGKKGRKTEIEPSLQDPPKEEPRRPSVEDTPPTQAAFEAPTARVADIVKASAQAEQEDSWSAPLSKKKKGKKNKQVQMQQITTLEDVQKSGDIVTLDTEEGMSASDEISKPSALLPLALETGPTLTGYEAERQLKHSSSMSLKPHSRGPADTDEATVVAEKKNKEPFGLDSYPPLPDSPPTSPSRLEEQLPLESIPRVSVPHGSEREPYDNSDSTNVRQLAHQPSQQHMMPGSYLMSPELPPKHDVPLETEIIHSPIESGMHLHRPSRIENTGAPEEPIESFPDTTADPMVVEQDKASEADEGLQTMDSATKDTIAEEVEFPFTVKKGKKDKKKGKKNRSAAVDWLDKEETENKEESKSGILEQMEAPKASVEHVALASAIPAALAVAAVANDDKPATTPDEDDWTAPVSKKSKKKAKKMGKKNGAADSPRTAADDVAQPAVEAESSRVADDSVTTSKIDESNDAEANLISEYARDTSKPHDLDDNARDQESPAMSKSTPPAEALTTPESDAHAVGPLRRSATAELEFIHDYEGPQSGDAKSVDPKDGPEARPLDHEDDGNERSGHDAPTVQLPPEYGRRSTSPSDAHDIDFAATVAAGLADSGFDPSMVINDPAFQRRASPPGILAEADPEEVFQTSTSRRKKKQKRKVLPEESEDSSRIDRDISTGDTEKESQASDVDAAIAKGLGGAGFDPALLQRALTASEEGSPNDVDDESDYTFATSKRRKGKKAKLVQDSEPIQASEQPKAVNPSDPIGLPPSEPGNDLLSEPVVDVTPASSPVGEGHFGIGGEGELDVDEMDRRYKAYKKNKRREKKAKAAAKSAGLSAGQDSLSTSETPISTEDTERSAAVSDVEGPSPRGAIVEPDVDPIEHAKIADAQPDSARHGSDPSSASRSIVQSTFPGLERVKRRKPSTTETEEHDPKQERSLGMLAGGLTAAAVTASVSARHHDHDQDRALPRTHSEAPSEPPIWSFDALNEQERPVLASPISESKERQIVRDSGYQEGEYSQRSSRDIPEIRSPSSRESLRSRRSMEPLHIPTSPDQDWTMNVPKHRNEDGTRQASQQHSRAPSDGTPLDATSKNRASYLFQSPTDNAISHGGMSDTHDQATPTREPQATGYFGTRSRSREMASEPENASRNRSAAFSPSSGPLSPRSPLDVIPEESRASKRSRARSDVRGHEQIKETDRAETPESIRARHRQVSSPATRQAASKTALTDEAIHGLSWPAVDDEADTVDLHRSLLPGPSKPMSVPGRDSPSVASHRSVSSGVPHRSPEDMRSYSRASNRSGTPSLRRTSLSGDLRAASRRGESASAVGARSSPITIPFEPPPTPPLNDEDVMDDRASRAAESSDVFQGYGDAEGLHSSPTRPPTVRKRQSMHISDLQSRVDQLIAENRALHEARQSRGLTGHDSDIQGTFEDRELQLQAKDTEINQLKLMLEPLQDQVAQLTEHNQGLTEANRNLVNDTNGRYATLQTEHAHAHQQWQTASRDLELMRREHGRLTSGMRDVVEAEIANALADKNAEIRELREQLDLATEQIRALHVQIQSSKSNDIVTVRDEDYFDGTCQKLCQHVQQWVLRFSKMSDNRVSRLSTQLNDDRLEARLDNAILDGSDVDKLLGDRIRRRDVFQSVLMTMVWEYIFTRYLFGMDREQRQKLKSLEKILAEVGPPRAVAQWRATTLSLLSQRPAFAQQCALDTEAVANEIFTMLCGLLPPPASAEEQLLASLQKVIKIAVDLSIEMRTQRAEYIMLPPLQPEYDANGDLVRKVHFNAQLMNERSGVFSSNEELAADHAVVKIVLFPLVVKKGDDYGEGEEEIVVCPAQVLVHNESGRGKRVVRVQSGAMEIDTPAMRDRQSRHSLVSEAPGSVAF